MAKILIAGYHRQETENPENNPNQPEVIDYDVLIEKLLEQGHKPIYTKSLSGMYGFLSVNATKYGVVVCDTRLIDYDRIVFSDTEGLTNRFHAFRGKVKEYLRLAGCRVIILADEKLQYLTRGTSEREGFLQLDSPYTINDVMEAVARCLG